MKDILACALWCQGFWWIYFQLLIILFHVCWCKRPFYPVQFVFLELKIASLKCVLGQLAYWHVCACWALSWTLSQVAQAATEVRDATISACSVCSFSAMQGLPNNMEQCASKDEFTLHAEFPIRPVDFSVTYQITLLATNLQWNHYATSHFKAIVTMCPISIELKSAVKPVTWIN